MESNSISFHMLPPGACLNPSSPSMADQMSVSKNGLHSEESTNYMSFQQFTKASHSSHSTEADQCESVQKNPSTIVIVQNQSAKKINVITKNKLSLNSKQNSSQTKPGPIPTKRVLPKAHSFVSIFDWMMEVASIMKLSRSVFYRACNILYQTYKIDQKVVENQNVEKYSCASLLISAKFQNANIDYLGEICQVNKKRMTKEIVTNTEIQIYQTLNWSVPIMSYITEEMLEVFKKWNDYLQKCQNLGLIRKETFKRLSLNLQFSESQPQKNKTYGQILYLTDILVMNQAKKYMTSKPIQTQQFFTPITVAMYSVFTIQMGDAMNRDKYLLLLFKNFYREQLHRTASQIDRLPKQIELSFMLFDFSAQISKIPLTKDWKQVINNDVQTYLPVNILKREAN